MTMGKFSSHEK